MENKEFNLEHQYQLYLKRVALKEAEMHSEQKKQLRQAFMGACGQIILLLRDEVGKLEEVEEERIEFVCEENLKERIVAAIRQAHPYEEPSIDICLVEI